MTKRIAFFNALLIIVCLCSCGVRTSAPEANTNDTASVVQDETISDRLLNDIESEYKKDAEKEENMTTAGMINLAYRYAEKWDAVSVEYHNKIITVADEAFEDKKEVITEKLDKLKKSYDEYAENNLDLYKEIYNLKYSGGSIIGPLCATEYYELKKDYALELVDIYEELTFDMQGYDQ